MFNSNKDFYPTPKHLINKMLFGLDFNYINSVLEPSAGKGDIVKALEDIKKPIHQYGRNKYNFDIDCIEVDQNLRHILKGKKYRVVHDDFLTYDTLKEYDLIIMNPPFSSGAKHLLKALEMQKRNGGAIICLLNGGTLKNQYSNDRVALARELKDNNATIEYLQDTFTEAERKTDVEIALIKVQLPKIERKSFIFNNLKKAEEEKEEYVYTENTHLVENDLYKAIVGQYKLEVEAGIKLIKEYKAMYPLIMREFEKDSETGEVTQTGGCILSLDLSYNSNKYSSKLFVNNFIREVRGKYWKALFNNPKFTGKLTSNLRQEYYNKVEELKDYDFSLYNIYEIRLEMNKNVIKGIEETIISLFDEFSSKYHYYDETSKNIHLYNGWKTNKAWIINKKVIIPLSGYDTYFKSYSPTDYKVVQKLKDIEKCFNYLDGGLTESISLEESLKFAEEYGETKNIQLKHFTVTFYKKGTCHITFNNEELLKKFNIFGSQYKGWLPPNYGNKDYKDMTEEEKTVINDFEGEKEYNKVMSNRKYYLFVKNNMNLLEDRTA